MQNEKQKHNKCLATNWDNLCHLDKHDKSVAHFDPGSYMGDGYYSPSSYEWFDKSEHVSTN